MLSTLNAPWYIIITLFNQLNAVNVPILELNIILCSRDKLHQYFGPRTIFCIVIDPDTTRNAMLFYCYPGASIDCLPVFFGLVFKVNLENFQKKRVFKVGTSILLKYIRSNFAIVFVRWYDFWDGWTCHFESSWIHSL